MVLWILINSLLCFGVSESTQTGRTDIHDQVSKALKKAYLSFERHNSFCGKEEKTDDPMDLFNIIQKQKANEAELAAAGYRFIDFMRALVDISGLKVDELTKDNRYQNAYAELACEKVTVDCKNYEQAKYRTSTGICNNLHNPYWGSALQPHARYMPPAYHDGIASPRKKSSDNISDLESPRTISNVVLSSSDETPEDDKRNLLLFAFGQFTDHDVILTPTTLGEADVKECCHKGKARKECFPIEIKPNDSRFPNTRCMPFARSLSVPLKDGCQLGYVDQLNRITSFIDAGQIYGDSTKAQETLDGYEGLMRTASNNMLPQGGVCNINQPGDYCQYAGDERVNEVPSLSVLHTVFVRYHNIIAKKLKSITKWESRHVYLETKKIIGAILQHITYGEYLPKVLSARTRREFFLDLKRSGHFWGYNKFVNPTFKNVVGAAALRYGHSQIPEKLGYMLHTLKEKNVVKIEDTLFDPHLILKDNGKYLEQLSRFLLEKPAKKVDEKIENGVRNELFREESGFALDLMSLNIQRGRDHGLQPYVEWRRLCELGVGESFENLTDHSEHIKSKLRKVYKNVNDIDVFVGGITETPKNGAMVGPLFECILGMQFYELRIGDRFWYENPAPAGFSTDQLDEIRKMTMAKIICDVLGMQKIQKEAFLISGDSNEVVDCSLLEDIDLTKWSNF